MEDRVDRDLRLVASVTAACAGAGAVGIVLHSLATTDAAGPAYLPLLYFSSLANLLIFLECGKIARLGRAYAGITRFGHCVTTAYLMALGAALYRVAPHPLHCDGSQFLAHVLVPAMVTVLWATLPAKAGAGWSNCFKWLAFPAGYTVLVLLHGAATHAYPYAMLDMDLSGPATVAINIVTAFVVLVLIGADIVLVEKVRVSRYPIAMPVPA